MSGASVRCRAKQLATLGEHQLAPGSHHFTEHTLTLERPWPGPDFKGRAPNLIAHGGRNLPRPNCDRDNISLQKRWAVSSRGEAERYASLRDRCRQLTLPSLRLGRAK